MALNKRTYTDGDTTTPIIASNLNAIQDEVIANATAISGKANQSTTYTKTEVDTALNTKANQSTTYTKTEVNSAISSAISGVTQFDYTVVGSLPATGVKGTIYLVANSGSGQNIYDEYIYITGDNARWEKIGTTDVDLTNYYNKSETDTAISTAISGQNTVTLEVTDENGNTGTLTVKGTLVWD